MIEGTGESMYSGVGGSSGKSGRRKAAVVLCGSFGSLLGDLAFFANHKISKI